MPSARPPGPTPARALSTAASPGAPTPGCSGARQPGAGRRWQDSERTVSCVTHRAVVGRVPRVSLSLWLGSDRPLWSNSRCSVSFGRRGGSRRLQTSTPDTDAASLWASGSKVAAAEARGPSGVPVVFRSRHTNRHGSWLLKVPVKRKVTKFHNQEPCGDGVRLTTVHGSPNPRRPDAACGGCGGSWHHSGPHGGSAGAIPSVRSPWASAWGPAPLRCGWR